MSSPSSPPLILDIRGRRVELGLARGACALALVIPWFFTAPLVLQGVSSILLLAIAYAGLRRAGWLVGSRRIVQIAWLADGRWALSMTEGDRHECELHHNSRVGTHAVWLRLRGCEPPHRQYSLLLTRADGPIESVRRLIVRLRLDGPRALSPADPLSAAR